MEICLATSLLLATAVPHAGVGVLLLDDDVYRCHVNLSPAFISPTSELISWQQMSTKKVSVKMPFKLMISQWMDAASDHLHSALPLRPGPVPVGRRAARFLAYREIRRLQFDNKIFLHRRPPSPPAYRRVIGPSQHAASLVLRDASLLKHTGNKHHRRSRTQQKSTLEHGMGELISLDK